MTHVTSSIHIASPPEAVWAIALDPARLADWVTIHRALHGHDSGPPRVGFRMNQTLTLRGAPFKVKWKLAECEARRRARWEGAGPAGSRAQTEYVLTPEDDGTRFDYSNDFQAPLGVIGRIAQRAIAGDLPQSEAGKSLLRLKELCESD